MSGSSRLAYHAVPKILKDPYIIDYLTTNEVSNENPYKSHFHVEENEWSPFLEYIKTNRINLNIRQVLL